VARPERKLILHAGAHKTGTSAIQQALHQYRGELLRESGIYYPDPAPWFGPSFVAHHIVAHAIATGEELPKVEDFLSLLGRQPITASAVTVLSSEVFYRQRIEGVEDETEARRLYLDRLAGYLAPFDVTVLVVLRRRDAFAESLYHELVSKGYPGSFDDFLEKAAGLFDYRAQVSAFAGSFETVRTVDYDELRRDGIVQGFLAIAGGAVPSGYEEPWVRKSPDARLSLWMAKRNAEDPAEQAVLQRRRFCRRDGTRDLFEDPGQVTIWQSNADRRALLASYGDETSEEELPAIRPARLTAEMEARIDAAFAAFAARARARQRRREQAAL
jgi:hypothetical protein